MSSVAFAYINDCPPGHYPTHDYSPRGNAGKCLALPTSLEEFQEDLADSDSLTAKHLTQKYTEEGKPIPTAEELWDLDQKTLEEKGRRGIEMSPLGLLKAAEDLQNRIAEDLFAEEEEEIKATALGISEVAFKEQCFLMAYVKELGAYKKRLDKGQVTDIPSPKRLPYVGYPWNASLLLDGDAFGFVNRLTMHSNQRAFFNMETQEMSKLQPMIRLFKIIEDENGVERQQEITFDSYLMPRDVSDFMTNKGARGHGVGIKSFIFSYEASNPFAIKKSIKAKLSLFANSFQELLRERYADDGSVYKYIDLALKTGGSETAELANKNNPQLSDEAYDNLTKLNFRLKAVVGYALPPAGGGVSSAVRDAVYDSYITINLTPTIHEFNLDDQGRVDFVINYLAYCEDFFDQPSFNIFSDPGVAARMIDRKMKFKAYNLACTPDDISKLKEETKNQVQTDRVASYQTLMANLLGAEALFSMSIPFNKIGEFLDKAPFYPFDEFEVSKNLDLDMQSEVIAIGTETLAEKGDSTASSEDLPGYEEYHDRDINEPMRTEEWQSKHGFGGLLGKVDTAASWWKGKIFGKQKP